MTIRGRFLIISILKHIRMINKWRLLTFCKLHCGCSGVRCLCSFLNRHVLADTDALRNPQRQLTSDRWKTLMWNKVMTKKQLQPSQSYMLMIGAAALLVVRFLEKDINA